MKSNEYLYKDIKKPGYVRSLIGFYIYSFLLFIFGFIIISIVINKVFAREYVEKILTYLLGFAVVVEFLLGKFILSEAARLRAEHHYSYWKAFIQVINEIIITLSYQPYLSFFFNVKKELPAKKEIVEEYKEIE